MIPIPPNHCVRLLQKRIEYGNISTSFIIEEPVVEKPDVDSKNASINDGIVLLKIYGKVPRREKTIHEITTDR
jgi:hypothetical protein